MVSDPLMYQHLWFLVLFPRETSLTAAGLAFAMESCAISFSYLIYLLTSSEREKLIPLFLLNENVTALWTILIGTVREGLAVATRLFAVQRTVCFDLIEVYLPQTSPCCLSDLMVQICSFFFGYKSLSDWRMTQRLQSPSRSHRALTDQMLTSLFTRLCLQS